MLDPRRMLHRLTSLAFKMLSNNIVLFVVLVVLPVWGLAVVNVFYGSCETTCDTPIFLAKPDVYGLYVVYGLTVLSYAISRKRPEQLSLGIELLVLSGMQVGALLAVLLAVHLGPAMLLLLFPPLTIPGLPLMAPPLVLFVLTREIHQRLERRGQETVAIAASSGLSSLAVIGLYALLMSTYKHRPSAALDVFTETCGGTFSTIVPQYVEDCHYLCTVAAQGHPSLVRPIRWGRRRGHPILVNRQLAIANAFEDLLHERWPSFGRLARRLYDRLGLPVARLLRNRWAADICYLAMKPAEWCFLVALLLLDHKSPEYRIDQMYR